jgi:hypothetical protein
MAPGSSAVWFKQLFCTLSALCRRNKLCEHSLGLVLIELCLTDRAMNLMLREPKLTAYKEAATADAKVGWWLTGQRLSPSKSMAHRDWIMIALPVTSSVERTMEVVVLAQHGIRWAFETLNILFQKYSMGGGARGTSRDHGPPYAMVHHEKNYG